jgi:hypothetical protein
MQLDVVGPRSEGHLIKRRLNILKSDYFNLPESLSILKVKKSFR